jgi:hypothetical protein
MTPTISTVAAARPGENVKVTGAGFDPALKFQLTTVDVDGVEVGKTSNINRPSPDGTFHVGIKVPPKMPCLIQAYQIKVVACTPVLRR